MKREYGWLAAVLLMYVIVASAFNLANPLFEAPDENLQFAYVRYLLAEKQLPLYRGVPLPMGQEAGQPPLYYALAALAASPADLGDYARVVRPNPHAALGLAGNDGNLNAFVHTADRIHPWAGTALAVHLAREAGVLLGAACVLATYLAGRLLFPETPELALAAAAVNAFTPGFIFISASVNNDILAGLAGAGALAAAAYGQHTGWKLPAQFAVGAAVGVAALSKLNALGVVPLVVLAVAVDTIRPYPLRDWRRWLGPLLRRGMTIASVAAAVSGWWYVRNIYLYGDPLASRLHFDVMAPKGAAPTLAQLGQLLLGTFKSWWGVFGWFNVVYPEWFYSLAALITIAGVAGFVWALGQRREWRQVLLAAWLSVFIAELIGWAFVRNIQGRLLLPAMPAAALILVYGLTHLLPRPWGRRIVAALAGGLALLAAVTPWAVISSAYVVPLPLTTAQVAALPAREPAQFANDSLRLIAAEAPASARPGETVTVTLAWSARQAVTGDHSIFVQLLGADFQRWAGHDSYPQNGARLTSELEPGAVYADIHRLRLPADMPWCNCSLTAGVYDFATGQRLPVAGSTEDFARLGDILVVDSEAATSRTVDMDAAWANGLRLTKVVLGPSPVQRAGYFNAVLYWETDVRLPKAYTVFVHLTATDGYGLAQHDGPPAAGRRETPTWQPGESIADVHAMLIPADLPNAEVQVRIGLYDSLTGERLRLADGLDELVVATLPVRNRE